MKKLTFLTLLLCASFTQMSAQFKVFYEVEPECWLTIVNASKSTVPLNIPINTSSSTITGYIEVDEYDEIQVSGGGVDYVVPVFTDNDQYVIDSQKVVNIYDYYWPENHNNTYSNSINVPCEFFVGMYHSYVPHY